MNRRTAVFFGAAALLIYLRLMYRVSYFPPFFEGEEAQSLDLAKSTCEYAAYTHSWWESVKGGVIEYNKGYAWALVPFYLHFGYDVRLITYILPVFFSIFLAGFFTLFRKAYPKSSLLSFAIVALYSVLCVCLRRYKWHSVIYLTAISVYLYFLPKYYDLGSAVRERCIKALALLLFAVSCYFYFGGFMYTVPFFILIVILGSKAQRRVELAAACVGMVAFLVFFAAIYNINDLWGLRIREEMAFVQKIFSHGGLDRRWWSIRDFFFTLYLSVPFLAMFAVGLVASVRRMWRGDRFALVNTVLFLYMWIFQVILEGVNNPDQLHWSMIPVLGVLLVGADVILVAIRDNVRGGSIIGALLVLLVGWHEMSYYLQVNRDAIYQPYIQDRNTMTQAALVLRMIKEDDSDSVQYYLPDPSVTSANGGFDYSVSLLRVDYAKALSRVVFFKSEEDLRKRLLVQRRDKWAVVYLSVDMKPDAKDAMDPAEAPLLGMSPEIIHPYADVYEIPFLVRKYRLRPGSSPVQALRGAT